MSKINLDEVNEQIAEVIMGWVKLNTHPNPHALIHPDIGKPGTKMYAGPWYYHPEWTPWRGGHMNGQAIPEFSRNVSDTWTVIEKLYTQDWKWTAWSPINSSQFKVSFYHQESGSRVEAEAETFQLATCLAALKTLIYTGIQSTERG